MAYTIFTRFDLNKDVKTLVGTEVTLGIWSGDTGSLTSVYTSSVQTGVSGEYFYDLYNEDPAVSDSAEVQFSVAYGHLSGSGSPPLDSNILKDSGYSLLPTQATYLQYRNILLNSTQNKFTFNGVQSDDIYVVNFQRARMRQALDAGNWQLSLSGSNGVKTYIDDSGLGTSVQGNLIANSVYNIRSGSITGGVVDDGKYYGLAFPDYGVLIFRPDLISSSVGFIPPTNSVRGGAATGGIYPFAPYTGSGITQYLYPHEGFVRAISGSMALNSSFAARSAEKITSTNYFVRLGNAEYNNSNNPTYFTGSLPQRPLTAFRDYPVTYVTTIGLYNDSNELLAVAKVSRPLQKSRDKEALIRVRLDY
jgi:hypothetical protein